MRAKCRANAGPANRLLFLVGRVRILVSRLLIFAYGIICLPPLVAQVSLCTILTQTKEYLSLFFLSCAIVNFAPSLQGAKYGTGNAET